MLVKGGTDVTFITDAIFLAMQMLQLHSQTSPKDSLVGTHFHTQLVMAYMYHQTVHCFKEKIPDNS